MKRLLKSIFLLCGVSLSLAAFPVFGQTSEINKQPLRDLAIYAKDKNVDWSKPFSVEMTGVLTKDGKLDAAQTKFVRAEGDPQTLEIVKRGFEAFSDSGWFGYLKIQGIEKIAAAAQQTAETFSVSIVSPQPTRERAKTLASGFKLVIQAALLLDKNGTKKLGDDEKKLLNGAMVTSDAKNVTINLSLPSRDFREMVQRATAK